MSIGSDGRQHRQEHDQNGNHRALLQAVRGREQYQLLPVQQEVPPVGLDQACPLPLPFLRSQLQGDLAGHMRQEHQPRPVDRGRAQAAKARGKPTVQAVSHQILVRSARTQGDSKIECRRLLPQATYSRSQWDRAASRTRTRNWKAGPCSGNTPHRND